MGVSDQIDELAALTPGKELPEPMHRRLGRFQILSGRCGEEKNLLSLTT
jgi:hypothetical protein